MSTQLQWGTWLDYYQEIKKPLKRGSDVRGLGTLTAGWMVLRQSPDCWAVHFTKPEQQAVDRELVSRSTWNSSPLISACLWHRSQQYGILHNPFSTKLASSPYPSPVEGRCLPSVIPFGIFPSIEHSQDHADKQSDTKDHSRHYTHHHRNRNHGQIL